MSQDHEYRMGRARIESIPPLDLLLVHHRHKGIGRAKQDGPAEVRWRYADDGKRMVVQPDNAAYRPTVILKMEGPIRVTKHDLRCAVRAIFIGAVEETAKI